jgi:peptidoglycan biosynthesis protein MviN/MurJ (putative lipid II flippase)
VGVAIRPQRGWRSERATQELVRRLRASIVVAACPSLSVYALLAVAATMPGGVVVLQMALQVFQLPLALGARAVSTAALPAMSDAASRRDTPAFAAAWRQALHYVVLAALPPLFLLIAFATAIAHTLATGQSGSAAVISSLATCIVVLAVAQLPAGLHEVGRQALFARLDVRGPRLAAGAHLAATVVLALLAALVPAGTPRLAGIAAATLVAEAVACVLVLQRIRRAISPERIADGRKLTAAGVGAMTMLPVVGAGWVLVGDGDEPLVDVPISLAIGALAVTLFAVSTMRLNRLA